jgi:hypothetical protein
VENRWLAFFVDIDLEQPFHLQVAPTKISKQRSDSVALRMYSLSEEYSQTSFSILRISSSISIHDGEKCLWGTKGIRIPVKCIGIPVHRSNRHIVIVG